MNPSHLIYGEKIKVLLNDIMNDDESIDKFRKELFSIDNFSLIELFHKLDKSKKSFINLTDFSDFLSSHSIKFNQFSLRRLIRTYDKKGKFLIIYDDFTNIIKPRYQNEIIQEETKRNEEEILIDIILSECKLIEKIGQQSINIRNCKDFTTFEAFMLISKGQKYINIDDLKIFLNNDNINDDKLEWVIYRLDLDNDKQVSYEEFQDIFFPFQNHLKVGEIEDTNIYPNETNDNNKNENPNNSNKLLSKVNYDNIKFDYKLNNNIENTDENLKEHLSDFTETIAKLTGSKETPINNKNLTNKDKISSILPLRINFQEKKNLLNNNEDENSYKIISFRQNDNINNDLNKNNDDKTNNLKYNYTLEKSIENIKYNINENKLDNNQENSSLNYINSENDKIKNINVNNMENNTLKDDIKIIHDNSNFEDNRKKMNINDLEDNENNKDIENNINYIQSNGLENSNGDIQSNGLENSNNNIQNNDLENSNNNIQNNDLENCNNNIQNNDLEINKNNIQNNILKNKVNYIEDNHINYNSYNDLESNRINNNRIENNNLELNNNRIENNNLEINNNRIENNNFESNNNNRIENNNLKYNKNSSQDYDFKNYKKLDYNSNNENNRMNLINIERNYNNGKEFKTNLTDYNKKFKFPKNNDTPYENSLKNIEEENDEKTVNDNEIISEKIEQIRHNESIKQYSQLTQKEIYRKPKNDYSLSMKNSPLKNIQNYQLKNTNIMESNLNNNSFSDKLKDSNRKLKYYSEKRPYIRKQFENSDIFTSNEFTSPIKFNNYESQFIPQIESSIEENNDQKNYRNYYNLKNNPHLNNNFNNEFKYNNKEEPFFSSESFIPSYYISSPRQNNVEEIFENELINQLTEFLSNIIEKKSVLESIKENLCLKDDITLEDLFYDFDISKEHEIKMEDFLQVCKNFGVFPTNDQIYLLYKKYDLDYDKVLSYTEFCQMILPIKKEYIMIISNRQINPLKNNEISSETKYMIKELIKGLINIETDLYEDRIKLKNKQKFSCINAWNLILKYSKNEKDLDKEGFKLFFEDNGYFYTKFEIEILFNDIDLDKNGKINYRDFAKIFLNV